MTYRFPSAQMAVQGVYILKLMKEIWFVRKDKSRSIVTLFHFRPDVKLGHYSGDITITTPVLYTEQLSLNSYLGHFTVTPNMIGTHVVCIQTSPDRK